MEADYYKIARNSSKSEIKTRAESCANSVMCYQDGLRIQMNMLSKSPETTLRFSGENYRRNPSRDESPQEAQSYFRTQPKDRRALTLRGSPFLLRW